VEHGCRHSGRGARGGHRLRQGARLSRGRAADTARPGDNVDIAAGTYTGGLTIKNNGSTGKYITFYGDGGSAVITGTGGSKGLIALGNHSYQRFIGITSTGSHGFGAYASGAHDLVFENFTVNGSQNGGLVLLGTSNIPVDGCDIHGTKAKGTSADHEAMSLGAGSTTVPRPGQQPGAARGVAG
jgi:hypothetical protein